MGCRPPEMLIESAYQYGYYTYLEDPHRVMRGEFATEEEREEALRGWDDAKLANIIDVRA